jgi:formylglycine-generating enzyme required for sulfatase activity
MSHSSPPPKPKFPTLPFVLAGVAVFVFLLLFVSGPDFNQRAQERIDRAARREAARIEREEQYIRETTTLEFGMIFVEGGTFMMGCTEEQYGYCHPDGREEPVHRVTLGSFYIGKYEVTQAQWELVTGSNPSHRTGANLPVDNVNWYDAQEFISKLNEQTGRHFRLPTEAEWEFAARGGNKSRGYIFSGSNNLNRVGWFNDNAMRAQPVGRRQPNELGIYDMSGNVNEWVYDWSEPYCSEAKINPTGPSDGTVRVIRGGAWFGQRRLSRVSSRMGISPELRWHFVGFRLAHPYKCLNYE